MLDWANPHNQHDAAEFLQFLSRLFCVDQMLGTWLALQEADSAELQTLDQGNFWPLTLPAALPSSTLPDQTYTTLQRLVILWRNQASRHAARDASSLPALFPMQVNRFDSLGNKVHTVIKPSAAVYIPYFNAAGIHTASCRYQLQAIIFHIGATKLQGHYRVALLKDGRLQHVTDDNIGAAPPSARIEELVNQNSYIFLLSKTGST